MPITKRSNRTRGTKADKMRPDLRARQMQPGSNRIRGAIQGIKVNIIQTVPGSCSYLAPATSCDATGTYEAVVSGEEGAVTYFWEIISGTAVIDTPTAKITDITTSGGDDQTFTVRVTVTDDLGSGSSSRTFSQDHDETFLADNLVTGTGDNLVTGDGDSLVTGAS